MKHSQVFTATILAGTLCLSACSYPVAKPNLIATKTTTDSESIELVNAIAKKPSIMAAMKTIEEMRARNIERLIEITEIPAPPFQETARANDFAERLKALGLDDVSIDDAGNVLARRRGTGDKTIALVAHLDTVFPPETDVTVRREGNVYYAPGIGDNSRGLVVLLSLVEALETHAIATNADLLFVGSVGEEGLGDLRGVRHLFRKGGPQIDSFIAIDGGGRDRLVVKAVGSNRYRVTFKGPGGHSFGAFGRAHPHQALADAITRFKLAATPVTESGPKATFSVGQIGGGTSINSIPFESWMEVDMRSQNPEKLAELDRVFKTSIQDALKAENARRKNNDPLVVEVKDVGKRPAGENLENEPLVLHASAAMAVFGLSADLRASSTDANVPISLGIPAITMSRGGRSRNAHAPNESWEDDESHLATQILLLTVLAEAN